MRLRARPIWLVLLFACGPQGGTEVGNPTFACGGGTDAAGSDDYDPQCTPGAAPTFVCGNEAPCELIDFGEVAVGQQARVTLVLENDGCDRVSVIADLGGPVELLDGPPFPATLYAEDRVTLTLGFTPTAPGPAEGDLVFTLAPGGEQLLPWVARGR